MVLMCCTQYVSKSGKPSSGPRTGKCVFIPVPKKVSTKNCSNSQTILLTSQISKVMLNILQARFQKYLNWELPDIWLGLEKAEEPEIKFPTR